MRYTKSFGLKDYDINKKILIYGAGNYGELAYRGLESWGLIPNYFVDANYEGPTFMGIDVIHPSELINYKNDIILIASLNYFEDMLIKTKDSGCANYYDILSLIEADYDLEKISGILKEEKAISQMKYKNVIENVEIGKMTVGHLEVVLTECCSLKCRDCANLMQYYEHPQNIEYLEIVRSLDNFLDSIDALIELRLIGGEPFIYNRLDEIINRYVLNEKIKKIHIYTNSTIVPSNNVIKSLRHSKVYVHLSNYGEVSSKIDELINIFSANGIEYYAHDYEAWNDVGGIEHRNYTCDEKNIIYRKCVMARCFTLYRGKFYICPRSAHGEKLGIFENQVDEVIDFSVNDINVDKKRRELKAIMNRKTYITACDYCNGSHKESRKIVAGLQK